MPLRFPRSSASAALVAALASLASPAAAQSEQLAMRLHLPGDAPIADVVVHAGESGDLCGAGEQLLREGSGWVCEPRATRLAPAEPQAYQTFEMGSASPGAITRFATACLGPEDRVIGGSCVRREGAGYASFAARATTAAGAQAVECALDGSDSASAVGIAVCLDLPPSR
jgi:hypothetical protein